MRVHELRKRGLCEFGRAGGLAGELSVSRFVLKTIDETLTDRESGFID
jgi:hypothetical protein